jgi:hypothetical protein
MHQLQVSTKVAAPAILDHLAVPVIVVASHLLNLQPFQAKEDKMRREAALLHELVCVAKLYEIPCIPVLSRLNLLLITPVVSVPRRFARDIHHQVEVS